VEQTRVLAPATEVWEAEQMLPTGRKLPAAGEFELVAGGPLAGRKFDTYFTGLRADVDGQLRTRLTDPESGRSVTQSFGPEFTQCVVYTPAHRQAICLEPYTCLPDPFRMTAEGYETGWQIMQPGESFETTLRITVD
jgi:aldose 1-epimerase